MCFSTLSLEHGGPEISRAVSLGAVPMFKFDVKMDQHLSGGQGRRSNWLHTHNASRAKGGGGNVRKVYRWRTRCITTCVKQLVTLRFALFYKRRVLTHRCSRCGSFHTTCGCYPSNSPPPLTATRKHHNLDPTANLHPATAAPHSHSTHWRFPTHYPKPRPMTPAPIPTKTVQAPPTPIRRSPLLPRTPTARRPPPAESTRQYFAAREALRILSKYIHT